MKNMESYDIVVDGRLYCTLFTSKAAEVVKADAIARYGDSVKIEVFKHVVTPYAPGEDNSN